MDVLKACHDTLAAAAQDGVALHRRVNALAREVEDVRNQSRAEREVVARAEADNRRLARARASATREPSTSWADAVDEEPPRKASPKKKDAPKAMAALTVAATIGGGGGAGTKARRDEPVAAMQAPVVGGEVLGWLLSCNRKEAPERAVATLSDALGGLKLRVIDLPPEAWESDEAFARGVGAAFGLPKHLASPNEKFWGAATAALRRVCREDIVLLMRPADGLWRRSQADLAARLLHALNAAFEELELETEVAAILFGWKGKDLRSSSPDGEISLPVRALASPGGPDAAAAPASTSRRRAAARSSRSPCKCPRRRCRWSASFGPRSRPA